MIQSSSLLSLSLSLMISFLPHLLIAEVYEERFETIYDKKLWGVNEENEGYSGGGSEIENVKPYYEYLIKFLRTHNIKTVVDIGCGDWTFSKHVDWSGIDYIGYDVVKSVIEKNIQRYASEHVHFVHANFLDCDLPPADLLICKHVLQHIPNRDVFRFIKILPHYKHSLILNAMPEGPTNTDHSIKPHFPFWEDRGIDLTLPPFNVKGKTVLTYAQSSNASGMDILTHIEHP